MDKLLTYNELAEIMGVSRRTIEFMVSAKKIPYVKLGGNNSSVRFVMSEIERWIELKKVKVWAQ